ATARFGPPAVAGRWYRLSPREPNATVRTAAIADVLLERHGVVTRGAVVAEGISGGFTPVYRVLAAMEERGVARRGYFIEGLGAAQFAMSGAVDRLRAPGGTGRRDGTALVLAATDPANPFGGALPWPGRAVDAGDGLPAGGPAHRAGRKAGALVVLIDGSLVLYVERGGRSVLSYTADPATLAAAADALAVAVRAGALGSLSVERADGESIHASPLHDALRVAGFRPTPRGLRLRG
ncbi:MAG: hypothetical protein HKP61_00280, partial [Dactylosporangium sp.]|nr:hypothetical protein [Dactylosporangium sp.]NNJ59409.1 hypothetical protein [Dactylosporangium sp.]